MTTKQKVLRELSTTELNIGLGIHTVPIAREKRLIPFLQGNLCVHLHLTVTWPLPWTLGLTANGNDPLTGGLISYRCSGSHHWLSTQRLVEWGHIVSVIFLQKLGSFLLQRGTEQMIRIDKRSTSATSARLPAAPQRPLSGMMTSLSGDSGVLCATRIIGPIFHYYTFIILWITMRWERDWDIKRGQCIVSLYALFILYLRKLCIRNHINSKGNTEPCKILLSQLGTGKIGFFINRLPCFKIDKQHRLWKV